MMKNLDCFEQIKNLIEEKKQTDKKILGKIIEAKKEFEEAANILEDNPSALLSTISRFLKFPADRLGEAKELASQNQEKQHLLDNIIEGLTLINEK